MVTLDREVGAEWVETFAAAKQAGDWAETSRMLSALDSTAWQGFADYRETCEGLAEIVDGLNRLNVALPAGVAASRDFFKGLMTTPERAPLTRRARLILVGGAFVAAAA